MNFSIFRRLLLTLLSGAICTNVWGSTDPEDIPSRPKWVFKNAILQAQNASGTTAVVDARDRLWITAWPDSKWMLPHSKIQHSPDGIEYGDLLVLWSTSRSGLWIKNRVDIRSRTGRPLQVESVEAPLLDVISYEDQVALLIPGEFRLLTPSRGESKTIPLPFIHPKSAEILDGKWVVRDARNRSVDIDPKTGCPSEFNAGKSALERWMAHQTQSVCGTPAALPKKVVAKAKLEKAAAIQAAAISSDPITLAAMGVRTKPQMKRIRPKEGRRPGSFRTRDEGIADVPERLLGPGHTVFIKHPRTTLPLREWVSGPYAPACHARILLMPEDINDARALGMRLTALKKAGNNCARSVYLTEIDAVDLSIDWAWYIDDEGHRVGRRTGKPSAAMVRMDLARLKQQDPLRRLADAPELGPEWTEGPGPSYEIALDINGSWVGDSGWDVVAGKVTHDLVNRVELVGPVRDIVVLPSGLIEAKTGGQPIRVEFRWATGSVEWLDEWPNSEGIDRTAIARQRSNATGAEVENWKVQRGVVYRPASKDEKRGPESEKLEENEVEPPNQLIGKDSPAEIMPGQPKMVNGNLVVSLPVPAVSTWPIEGGAIVETTFGLVGIDAGGSIRWRLTDVNDWVVSGDWLIAATPWGVRGHRIPPPVSESTNTGGQALPGSGSGAKDSQGGRPR